MLRALLAVLLALLGAGVAHAAEDRGRFVEIAAVPSTEIAPSHVVVWLPPGYDRGRKRYGVVYLNDGQNLFFPERSGFNKVWAADKAVLALIAAKRIDPVILVGIDHPGKDRYRQYFPQAIDAAASTEVRAVFENEGPVYGDAYLKFLVTELKPLIDRTYRTRRDARHTAIAGSSMGGLISCYAIAEYPAVFGRAACVSTHWLLAMPDKLPPGADVLGLWHDYFTRKLGRPRGRRVWMDHGTETLDALYDPWQRAIDADFIELGWRRDRDFASRVYPGAAHEENAWATRLPEVFAWLLAD